MKIFGLALASTAALALTACGGGAGNSSTSNTSNGLAADPLSNLDAGYGNASDYNAGTNSLGAPGANSTSDALGSGSTGGSATGDSAAGNSSAGNSAAHSTNTVGNSH